jgi:hypothetical protein
MSEKNYLLSIDSVNLINASGERVPALSVKQTYEKLKKSYWRTGGWAAAVGVFAVFSLHNVSEINKQIKADISNRYFKGGSLVSGSATEGTIFFKVPPEIDNINNWKLSVILKNGKADGFVNLDYSLSGNIEVRNYEIEDSDTEEDI